MGEPTGHTWAVRLFIGVWPSDEIIAGLGELTKPGLAGVRWTTPTQWHVTLCFLGEQQAAALEVLETVLRRAGAVAGGPVEVRIGPSTIRLGAGVLCLPVDGLDGLAESVARELETAGIRPADGPGPGGSFRGHLTLARARRGARIPARLLGVAFEGAWAAEELCLVSSVTAPGGARYETILRVTIH